MSIFVTLFIIFINKTKQCLVYEAIVFLYLLQSNKEHVHNWRYLFVLLPFTAY